MGTERLLRNEPTSAYWLGFLLADGTFSRKRIRLRVAARDADRAHLLARFLGARPARPERKGSVYGMSLQDPAVARVVDRFGIRPRKTYNPPRQLPYSNKTLLFCLFVGLADGDGHIGRQSGRDDCFLTFHVHRSWTKFYKALNVAIGSPGSLKRYDEYLTFGIYDNAALAAFARLVDKIGLPVLERKWKLLDRNYTSPRCRSKRAEIQKLLAKHVKGCEIAKSLGVSQALVSMVKTGRYKPWPERRWSL